MAPFNLCVCKGKSSDNGPKKSHELKSALDWRPDEAEEYVSAGQKDHCEQEDASYPDKYLGQNTAYLIQEFHIRFPIDWLDWLSR